MRFIDAGRLADEQRFEYIFSTFDRFLIILRNLDLISMQTNASIEGIKMRRLVSKYHAGDRYN